MASGYISGKKNTLGSVNIPYKEVSYQGEETSTANVVIDNYERTISVDVNVENVTKQCATKTEVRELANNIYDKEEINQLLDEKQDKLIAGNGIKIEDNVISAEVNAPIWGNISGNIADQEDLQNELDDIHESVSDEKDRAELVENELDNRISDIEELIPSQASEQNKLADKDFVNSSIATNTAYFKGTFNIVTDLELTVDATHIQVATALLSKVSNPTNNDYVFVSYPDVVEPTQFTKFERYKYNSLTQTWSFEFELNNSSFTAEQWASINSGITAEMINNFVTTNTEQTITGIKTFNSSAFKIQLATKPNQPLTFDFDTNASNNEARIVYLNNRMIVMSSVSVKIGKDLIPYSNTYSLGNSTYKWKDLYLSRNLTDGTNSVTIADLAALEQDVSNIMHDYVTSQDLIYYATKDEAFNEIKAADISNPLTTEQVAIFKNGKPTIIKGIFLGLIDAIYYPASYKDSGQPDNGLVVGQDSSGANSYYNIKSYTISSSNVLSIVSATGLRISFRGTRTELSSATGVLLIKNKIFPNYPTTNTSPQVLTIGANGGSLSWENHMTEWYGTQAQYDALGTYDSNTIYNILES